MPSDKLHQTKITQTGAMPRAEIEPELLHREAPPPILPEIKDDENTATTGEMPVVLDADKGDNTRDEDTPTGK